jgi:hypothetical protein
MSRSQMQIWCLPGSQMGFTSMQHEPVRTGAGVESGALRTNTAAEHAQCMVRDAQILALPLRVSTSMTLWTSAW